MLFICEMIVIIGTIFIKLLQIHALLSTYELSNTTIILFCAQLSERTNVELHKSNNIHKSEAIDSLLILSPQYVGKVPELYWMVQSSINLVSSILKSGTNTVLVKHFVLSDCPWESNPALSRHQFLWIFFLIWLGKVEGFQVCSLQISPCYFPFWKAIRPESAIT